MHLIETQGLAMTPLTNPVALAARQAAKKSLIAQISRTVEDSRTADKFVIRTTLKFASALSDLAASQGRSLNAEVVLGLIEALTGGTAYKVTSAAMSALLGREEAAQVLRKVKRFSVSSVQGEHQFIARLPNGLRGAVSGEVELAKLEGEGCLTLQSWFHTSLVWWVNTNLEIRALTAACEAKHADIEALNKP